MNATPRHARNGPVRGERPARRWGRRGARAAPASAAWVPGNRIALLENGEAFFPRVFEVIGQAREEVLLETFILFDDHVGQALHEALVAAAQRGVRVSVLVDGYGSMDLGEDFLAGLTRVGVQFRMFDPRARLLGLRTNVFRRMHRKLVVVDGAIAFVGGINYSADHLADFGPGAKQDYAIEVHGPVVAQIRAYVRTNCSEPPAPVAEREPTGPPGDGREPAGTAQTLFAVRDNGAHRTDIERQYRIAIRAARHDVIIANAYFFPGYRLLRDLRNAARRGVRVSLVLQGEPDMPIVKVGARLLHDYLLGAGVRIFEYCERPLHGKVAVADDEWATVGSSNLDPLSLSLNLEANLVIRDAGFNRVLRERLDTLIARHCRQVRQPRPQTKSIWRAAVSSVVFHVLRRFPAWAGWLPKHVPRLEQIEPAAVSHAGQEDDDAQSRQTG
ncbi:Putative cardiolipin synthase YbhO [Pigmentiphaga humi]|uniref:Cardiolipin synthase B n=1 Tax=Pigmentiphaga humi TaxID=2478468 RepID=A0A3P4B8A1_9BURK|nr:cardiolipin synthase ClsB [Pigmentiphaga humi]VCU72161.1 Putative cardiolipin synthase YbhO [Pigmentiphaga humi]